jgi:hypothetical protein
MIITTALAIYASAIRRNNFTARVQTIGSSEVGRCARALYFLKNEDDPIHGTPRNPDFVEGWGAPIRGTVFEEHYWEPALRAAYGERLRFAGKEQETFIKDFLSATPDGLLVDLDDDALAPLGVKNLGGDRSLLLECKSVHPNTRLTEPKLAHAFQVQVGLGLIRELTEHRPEFALISYTNASDWSDTREFPVKRDPAIFDVAQRRALRILTAMFAEALPPEGLTSGGRECEWCPFSNACLSTESANLKSASTNEASNEAIVRVK